MNANEQRIESREKILKVMDKTFVMVPAKLFRDVADEKITSSAFALYCYLLFRQGKKQQFWGSIQDICQGTGISSAQVSRLLKQLVKAGHITRVKRVGTTWITRCLTRVDDHKIIFRGKAIDGVLTDAAMDGDTERKALASDRAEVQSGQTSRDDEISEAVRLFEEELASEEELLSEEELFREETKLHRELGINPPPRSTGRFYKRY